jgi:U3 small nucleolar RNA-associated protein 25
VRVRASSAAAAADARFAAFVEREAAPLLAEGVAHALLFVPSYFDYVRLRNALDAREAEFVTASEYSDDRDVARARSRFQTGASPLLVVTERFHFFRRVRFRGARHIIFYAPPTAPAFYADFVNLLAGAGRAGAEAASVTLLYTRYDAPALERIVGTARVARLVADDARPAHVFI